LWLENTPQRKPGKEPNSVAGARKRVTKAQNMTITCRSSLVERARDSTFLQCNSYLVKWSSCGPNLNKNGRGSISKWGRSSWSHFWSDELCCLSLSDEELPDEKTRLPPYLGMICIEVILQLLWGFIEFWLVQMYVTHNWRAYFCVVLVVAFLFILAGISFGFSLQNTSRYIRKKCCVIPTMREGVFVGLLWPVAWRHECASWCVLSCHFRDGWFQNYSSIFPHTSLSSTVGGVQALEKDTVCRWNVEFI